MMVVYSNIHRELTAQVKDRATTAANIMVTVVATQELEAGAVLRRFKAEASQDDPRRGNNNNRYRNFLLGLVALGVWKSPLHMGFFSLVCWCFSSFRWYTFV